MTKGEVHHIVDILDRLESTAKQSGHISGQDIIETFGSRSYGPFLILPPLLEISPIGGLPGVATAMAFVVVLIAGQLLLGRTHCWLPSVITRRTVSSSALKKAASRTRPIATWLDCHFHGRLEVLTRGPFVRIAAIACIALALTIPFLELVPFASTAPMAAIALFGLALLVHDGALMIAATLTATAAIAVVFALVVL